ncbi:MAG: riboflavin synthase [bacterium]|nr:riboflavin synthase [bacterium]
MFTGIIEEIGTVIERKDRSTTISVGIIASKIFDDLKVGDSISVDGVCLTVEDINRNVFYASLSPETLRLTTLGKIRYGISVNLERAAKYGTRIGGHLLTGHIDFKTRITSKRKQGENSIILVKIPSQYKIYFVKKGSVGIDGISLTIADIINDNIAIWLIPHTIKNTTMRDKKIGDEVNVEIDMIAKVLVETNINLRKKNGKISKEAIM